MRTILFEDVVDAVSTLCIKINHELEEQTVKALNAALEKEKSIVAKDTLTLLLDNAAYAKKEYLPLCQDTGTVVAFIEMGEGVQIIKGSVSQAITLGVKKGYQEGFLRKSMCDPFTRKNTGDNCPVIIHYDFVEGDGLSISLAAKGGGSENKSRIAMLSPAQGVAGIKKFVLDTVTLAGADPCPPIVVGVGIGGNFEACAIMAKKALFRKTGLSSQNEIAAHLEKELLQEINNTGIGPAGLGGKTTALAVHINVMPCHIASLPVAVNLNCHSVRHGTITL